MARYIDADALKRKLIDEKAFFPATVARAIDETPTADVVEVVRCKDCACYVPIDDKQFVYNGKPAMYCFIHSVMFHKNDYCSYGVRSDSE